MTTWTKLHLLIQAVAESKMKLCKGCRHLHEYKGRCRLGYQTEIDQYSGLEYGWNILSVKEARAEDGICGPNASRYEPKFWAGLLQKLQGKV